MNLFTGHLLKNIRLNTLRCFQLLQNCKENITTEQGICTLALLVSLKIHKGDKKANEEVFRLKKGQILLQIYLIKWHFTMGQSRLKGLQKYRIS